MEEENNKRAAFLPPVLGGEDEKACSASLIESIGRKQETL